MAYSSSCFARGRNDGWVKSDVAVGVEELEGGGGEPGLGMHVGRESMSCCLLFRFIDGSVVLSGDSNPLEWPSRLRCVADLKKKTDTTSFTPGARLSSKEDKSRRGRVYRFAWQLPIVWPQTGAIETRSRQLHLPSPLHLPPLALFHHHCHCCRRSTAAAAAAAAAAPTTAQPFQT